MPLDIAAKSNPATFKAALNRLSTDTTFRKAVLARPETLTKEFKLSLRELHALRQAAIMSGADMTRINKVRAREIANAKATLTDIDIDISCCCCCCCGETAVVRIFA